MILKVQKITIYDNPSSRLLAACSIIIDEQLAIHNIRIVKKPESDNYIIAFPSYLDKKGKYINLVHPITEKLRQDINEAVLTAFFIQKNKNSEVISNDENISGN